MEKPQATGLDMEYSQLTMTRCIIDYLTSRVIRRQSSNYELSNVMERWLISMINTPGRSDDYFPWAKVYRLSRLDEEFNIKMTSELVEKRLIKTDARAKQIVEEVLAFVARTLKDGPVRTGAEWFCRENLIGFGRLFESSVNPRIQQLIKIGGPEAVLKMLLRYATVLSGGQQWSVPRETFDFLYKEFELRNEGFASPLNAGLLGKPNARFCSLFVDTDGVFGSIGEFFAVNMPDHPGAWLVNPPFVEAILDRAAKQVVELLPGMHEAVFFIGPAWNDGAFYKILQQSEFFRGKRILAKNTYFFESPDGKTIPAKFDSVVFALKRTSDKKLAGALARWTTGDHS